MPDDDPTQDPKVTPHQGEERQERAVIALEAIAELLARLVEIGEANFKLAGGR